MEFISTVKNHNYLNQSFSTSQAYPNSPPFEFDYHLLYNKKQTHNQLFQIDQMLQVLYPLYHVKGCVINLLYINSGILGREDWVGEGSFIGC